VFGRVASIDALRYCPAMDAGDVPEADNLDRLRDLCADLARTTGCGQLLAWAAASVPADVPDVVFGVVSDAGLLAAGKPQARTSVASARRRPPAGVPADADELWSRLWEVDEPAAVQLLVSLEVSGTRDSSRRARRLRRYQDEPGDVFAEMARLTGPGTRWWTNTDLSAWNPVTQHPFDAMVVGAGNGMVVTLIAFDGGEAG
jgi:hypothetical protein